MARHKLHVARGANSTYAARMLSNNTGKSAGTDVHAWDVKLRPQHLSRMTTSQLIAITIDGDDDGDYILTFSGGGLAEPVVLDAFAASGDTVDDIAAGLEAIIEAARAVDEPLNGVVTSETVSTDTISVVALNKAPATPPLVVTYDFPGAVTATFEYTYVGTVEPGDTLSNYRVREFYEKVVRKQVLVSVSDPPFVGPDAFTVDVGYLTGESKFAAAVDLLTDGVTHDLTADDVAERFASALVPLLTFTAVSTTAIPFQALEPEGELTVEIHYAPVPPFPGMNL